MIDRKKLEEILDKQYQHCKRNIIDQILINMDKLQNYRGDVIDIRTEINMGKSMEGTLFYEIIEDYHNKDSFVLDSVPEGPENKISLDQLFWPHEYKPRYRTQTVTAPKHKKKYLIKLNDGITQEQGEKIAQEISEQQFIVYNQDTIEQIITLDVE